MLNIRPNGGDDDPGGGGRGGGLEGSPNTMEFLRILIHQHANTIVSLKELQAEVDTIKKECSLANTNKSSPLVSSRTSRGHLISTPSATNSPQHGINSSSSSSGVIVPSPLNSPGELPGTSTSSSARRRLFPGDVWNNCLESHPNGAKTTIPTTSTAAESPPLNLNNKIDSGFSGNSNGLVNPFGSPSTTGDNPLFSLLSFIETKIREPGSAPGSEYYHSGTNLGSLDALLGFNRSSGLTEAPGDLKECIRAILNEKNIIELKRQLIYALVRVRAFREDLMSRSKVEVECHRDSEELEKLKTENEQLRFRLEEMDIELEGTNARFRMLSKSLLSQNGSQSPPSPPETEKSPTEGGRRLIRVKPRSPPIDDPVSSKGGIIQVSSRASHSPSAINCDNSPTRTINPLHNRTFTQSKPLFSVTTPIQVTSITRAPPPPPPPCSPPHTSRNSFSSMTSPSASSMSKSPSSKSSMIPIAISRLKSASNSPLSSHSNTINTNNNNQSSSNGGGGGGGKKGKPINGSSKTSSSTASSRARLPNGTNTNFWSQWFS